MQPHVKEVGYKKPKNSMQPRYLRMPTVIRVAIINLIEFC